MIKLHILQSKDLPKLHKWLNDREANKFFNTRSITMPRLKKYVKTGWHYVIKYNKQTAGWIGLNKDGFIVILVYPDFQGRGIGKKAIRLIEKVARKKKLKMLQAACKDENKRMPHVLKKCGWQSGWVYLRKMLK